MRDVICIITPFDCKQWTGTPNLHSSPAVLWALSHFYVSPFIHTFASTFALPTFEFYTYLLSHFRVLYQPAVRFTPQINAYHADMVALWTSTCTCIASSMAQKKYSNSASFVNGRQNIVSSFASSIISGIQGWISGYVNGSLISAVPRNSFTAEPHYLTEPTASRMSISTSG